MPSLSAMIEFDSPSESFCFAKMVGILAYIFGFSRWMRGVSSLKLREECKLNCFAFSLSMLGMGMRAINDLGLLSAPFDLFWPKLDIAVGRFETVMSRA